MRRQIRQSRHQALAIAAGQADTATDDDDGRIEQQLKIAAQAGDDVGRTVDDGFGPRLAATGGGGLGNDTRQATEINSSTAEVTKVYLRELPVDPMTGKSDWRLRSSYQDQDDQSWDNINVFDVSSASDEEAMNGEKYSDW